MVDTTGHSTFAKDRGPSTATSQARPDPTPTVFSGGGALEILRSRTHVQRQVNRGRPPRSRGGGDVEATLNTGHSIVETGGTVVVGRGIANAAPTLFRRTANRSGSRRSRLARRRAFLPRRAASVSGRR